MKHLRMVMAYETLLAMYNRPIREKCTTAVNVLP
jgi:hypothetical protein